MSSNRASPTRGIVLAVALIILGIAAAGDAKGRPAPPAAAAALLPDLVLEGPQFTPTVDFTQVSYTVRNVGGKDSKATTVRTLCLTLLGAEPRCEVGSGWTYGAAVKEHTYETAVPPLHKGESVTLPVFYFGNFGTGAYKISGVVVVDPDNLVPESNETNNRSSFTKSREAPAVPANAVGVPAGGTPAPTPTHVSGASAGAPLATTNVSLLKPTPTPIPALTLSVDPAYSANKQIFLIARNNTTTALGAGTAKFDCRLTAGGTCSVIGTIPFPVPPLAPGQWQTLGTFEVSTPGGPHTVTITTDGVASKPLVLKYP